MEPHGDAPEEEEEGMTMLEHLEELRDRLIVCSVALVVGLVISAVPIPWLTTDSVTQTVMELIARAGRRPPPVPHSPAKGSSPTSSSR